MRSANHTCASGGRSLCAPCMRLEVELWDAINSYAVTVGGNPSERACGNVPRMQAVAAVNAIVAGVSSRQQVDDLTVEELARGHNAAAAAACSRGEEIVALRGKLRALDLAHKHLSRLYAESRAYVDTLTRERDALVEAARGGGRSGEASEPEASPYPGRTMTRTE